MEPRQPRELHHSLLELCRRTTLKDQKYLPLSIARASFSILNGAAHLPQQTTFIPRCHDWVL